MVNTMRNNYFDVPRFLIRMKISSDAKVLYSLMLHMDVDAAVELANISSKNISKVKKELEENGLTKNGIHQDENIFLKERKIINIDFKKQDKRED